ncbi:MAG: hypothetical protein K2H47_05130 [Muribaculaceae bacterium]|nr:hypothetical protein [Muribaculaceae bacterium]
MTRYLLTALLTAGFLVTTQATTRTAPAHDAPVPEETVTITEENTDGTQESISRVLFIGDSMTGWMAERLNAYGNQNDFEVATVVWDGSTISKWAESAPRIAELVDKIQPQAVFISLGLNELFEKKPSRLAPEVDAIVQAVGDRPLLWIGPPSWPGHSEGEELCSFLESRLGEGRYFNSFDLNLERQSKSNPHPSRDGIVKWMDEVVNWIPDNTGLQFKSLNAPDGAEMSRGQTFIYRRMQDNL